MFASGTKTSCNSEKMEKVNKHWLVDWLIH
jgi:hypothetical protein